MAEPKTRPTTQSVAQFVNAIADPTTRADCRALVKLMQEVTGEKPVMWGTSIVGFGTYRYEYRGGRTAEWPLLGFSPRKRNLTLYLMTGLGGHDELLEKLGPHKTAKSCLYLAGLEGIHLPTLKKMLRLSIKTTKRVFPE
jgi:hypothetical protein